MADQSHPRLDATSHYLDHAATTPARPEVVDAVADQVRRTGNPSSLHAAGRDARRVVEESRERLASALGCRPGEVLFTSGGTESDNLALKGLYWRRRDEDPRRVRVLVSAVEHHAVLDQVGWLSGAQGAKVEVLPVDQHGRLDLGHLERTVAADPDTVAVVSVMWANNEVGTLQPVPEVVAVCGQHGIPVHTDAVQAVGAVAVDLAGSGVAALSLTGHKLGGQVGTGALVVGRDVALTPLQHGGGHEREMRSGTLDAAGVLGLSLAVEHAVGRRAEHAAHLRQLRDDLVSGVRAAVPDAVLHGHPEHHLPGIAHLGFPGCEGDSLLMLLDAQGVEVSTGSACAAGVPQPSHVLLAMGHGESYARTSLRFSLGWTSTDADVAAAVEAIGPAVARARAAGSVGRGGAA